ncbi:MAG: hypothetical protein BECKG1743D_GA0114223_102707 [Candidatus Kentron sp. G]|nr:MAG: hypothetical protein BECKG1743F_GA0114225_101785 [Candidatus Kentron sp. G]VFN01315.1 MAG: hypothetical protein BECKG1743D_GA0114223_102707 [Candidatus Kentron sp. G]VFN03438.1 MAG: hypothetical protein BECKG1743E_GA0114224_106167 [Candidatus Kentron sp. G]
MMNDDPVVEEIRRYRAEHAARYDHDLTRICEALREREEQSRKEFVRFPPKSLESKKYSS